MTETSEAFPYLQADMLACGAPKMLVGDRTPGPHVHRMNGGERAVARVPARVTIPGPCAHSTVWWVRGREP